MPIYEYKCKNGHVFEAVQSMSEDPLSECQECGAPVERVFHPVAVHFKGKGFYTTDYGSKAKGGGDGAGKEADKKPDEKASKTPEKPKSEAKSEST